jgi:hypothetical protein
VSYEYGEHCQGTFTGTMNVIGRGMAGAYIGQNCVHEFGALTATKID